MSDQLDPSPILQLARGFMGSKAMLAAVKLGVFDALRDGPLTGEDLRKRLNLHARAIPDFPDSLVALGMLARQGDGAGARYANTPEGGAFLVRSSERWIGGIIEMFNDRLYPFWSDLEELVDSPKLDFPKEKKSNASGKHSPR